MTTSLDVVIPVLNEERDLPPTVDTLHEFLSRRFSGYDWRIVIADNGSTDSTPEASRQLVAEYPRVSYTRLEQRGRGRALREVWSESQSDIFSYMDVDLSTDLSALPELVKAIEEDGYDVVIGSRLAEGAEVIGRPLKRELISRAYNFIIKAIFFTRLRDSQCGFKAVSRRVACEIVPLVQATGWFFDTELLLLAEKNGYRVKEVPVKWTDDPDSRVKVLSTALEDIRGLLRMRFGGLGKASRLLARRDGAL